MMSWTLESNWKPTRLLEVAGSIDTSTGVTEVTTDAGPAYLKALGNRQGPHVLATDWVGTHLAKWLGLSIFEIAILTLDDEDEFVLPRGAKARAGPAFAAKAMAGEAWDGSENQLAMLVNPADITRLVVFDTWTLNCDRHDPGPDARKPNYDNVYLSREGAGSGKRRLIAIDHGLCFIRSGEELAPKLAQIDKVKDPRVYGLFPAFRGKLRADVLADCAARLRTMDAATARAIIATVPKLWEVSDEARNAWCELIWRRASFVANIALGWPESAPWFSRTGE